LSLPLSHAIPDKKTNEKHQAFSIPTIRALAAAARRPFPHVATPAAATIWNLAVDRHARASLVAAGAVDALAAVIADQMQAAEAGRFWFCFLNDFL
jgi:hypothetical protein